MPNLRVLYTCIPLFGYYRVCQLIQQVFSSSFCKFICANAKVKVGPKLDVEDDDPLLLYAIERPRKRRRPNGPQHVSPLITENFPPTFASVLVETSDAEERDLLAQPSRGDFWRSPNWATSAARSNLALDSSLSAESSHNTTRVPLMAAQDSSGRTLLSNFGSPRHDVESSPFAARSSSPIGHNNASNSDSDSSEGNAGTRSLRPRKQIQLQPYTVEHAQYRANLKRRGQTDAIVRVKDMRRSLSSEYDEAEGDWQPLASLLHSDGSPRRDPPLTARSIGNTQSSSLSPPSPKLPPRRRSDPSLLKRLGPDIRTGHSRYQTASETERDRLMDPRHRTPSKVRVARHSNPSVEQASVSSHTTLPLPPRAFLPPPPSSSSSSSSTQSEDESDPLLRATTKQRRALKRMLPKVMIKQLARQHISPHSLSKRSSKPPNHSPAAQFTLSASPERGTARVRRRGSLYDGPIRIVGDSETDTDSASSSSESDNSDPDQEIRRTTDSLIQSPMDPVKDTPTRPKIARPAPRGEPSQVDRMISRPRKSMFRRSRQHHRPASYPTFQGRENDVNASSSESKVIRVSASANHVAVPGNSVARRRNRPRNVLRHVYIFQGHKGPPHLPQQSHTTVSRAVSERSYEFAQH